MKIRKLKEVGNYFKMPLTVMVTFDLFSAILANYYYENVDLDGEDFVSEEADAKRFFPEQLKKREGMDILKQHLLLNYTRLEFHSGYGDKYVQILECAKKWVKSNYPELYTSEE